MFVRELGSRRAAKGGGAGVERISEAVQGMQQRIEKVQEERIGNQQVEKIIDERQEKPQQKTRQQREKRS